MRPLNRPMFRYGGPIKEGVMSGIREPKKSGGVEKVLTLQVIYYQPFGIYL